MTRTQPVPEGDPHQRTGESPRRPMAMDSFGRSYTDEKIEPALHRDPRSGLTERRFALFTWRREPSRIPCTPRSQRDQVIDPTPTFSDAAAWLGPRCLRALANSSRGVPPYSFFRTPLHFE